MQWLWINILFNLHTKNILFFTSIAEKFPLSAIFHHRSRTLKTGFNFWVYWGRRWPGTGFCEIVSIVSFCISIGKLLHPRREARERQLPHRRPRSECWDLRCPGVVQVGCVGVCGNDVRCFFCFRSFRTWGAFFLCNVLLLKNKSILIVWNLYFLLLIITYYIIFFSKKKREGGYFGWSSFYWQFIFKLMTIYFYESFSFSELWTLKQRIVLKY